MPRLIKLSSAQEVVADFQSFFNEDIVLPPNSKVALLNLSLTIDQNAFEINTSNNTFQVQNKGQQGSGGTGGLFNCTLTPGTYNKNSLITEITRAINSLFSINSGSTNGLDRPEWKPYLNPNNKLTISFSATTEDNNNAINFVLGKFAWSTGNTLSKTVAGTDATWECCFASTIFNNGVGLLQCTLPNTNNGVCVGFINDAKIGGPTFTPADYFLSIYTAAGVYQIMYNGAIVQTPIAPIANDIISIQKQSGQYVIYRTAAAGGGAVEINRFPAVYDQLLHGAISMFNKNNQVTNVSYTPSPFQKVTSQGVSIINVADDLPTENYISFDNVGGIARGSSIHRLVLPYASAQLLGFATVDNTTVAVADGQFDGVNVLNFGKLSETITVEMPSLNLEGYDSDVHRRRSILYVLPAGAEPDEQRDYNATYPIYIEMNNKFPQSLNTIHVRILDEAGLPVKVDSGIGVVLTILID